MAEDGTSHEGQSPHGDNGGAKTAARWVWVIFLSFIAFWPILGHLNENSGVHRNRYGYGRKGDLSQIGKAMYAYSENYGEQLPPSLWTLYPQYIDRPRTLVSPGDIDPRNSGGFLNRYIYLYEGGGAMPTQGPLVIYPYEVEGGRVRCVVLFADGRVEYGDDLAAFANGQERGRR